MNPFTLEKDIENVLRTGEGWTEEISEWVGSDIAWVLSNQFAGIGETRRDLRLSNIGTKCERKLWYSANWRIEPDPVSPSTQNKFIYGNITESYVHGLCMAAGHRVEGMQDSLVVGGVRGHRDSVIDGMLFDIKSAATFSFNNFTKRGVRESDNYGYVSQLSSYLYASRDDPLVDYKDKAGFIFFDKQFGNISVQILDLAKELENKESEIAHKVNISKADIPPARQYEAEFGKLGTSKNPALPTQPCGYCNHKIECWGRENLHIYKRKSDGYLLYFTKVNVEPNEDYWEKVYE